MIKFSLPTMLLLDEEFLVSVITIEEAVVKIITGIESKANSFSLKVLVHIFTNRMLDPPPEKKHCSL